MVNTARNSNFKHLLLTISIASALVFSGLSAEAATLGKINVLSNLGQPLNAEIALLPATPEELAAIKASIASKDVFAEQGVTRSDVLSDVQIGVATLPDGQSVLRLTSTAPISQPATDVLVQVDWGSGSLTRLYTVVLAPAPAESAAAAVAAPVVPDTPAAPAAEAPSDATSEALPDDVSEDTLNDDLTAEMPLPEDELPAPDEQATEEDTQQQDQDDLTQYVPMDGEMGYMTKDDDAAPATEESAAAPEATPPTTPDESNAEAAAPAGDELPPVESTMEDIPPTDDVALNDDLTAEIPMEETPAETPIVGEPIKSEYAVSKGDTLRNIAIEMGQPNVSLEQMMVGLYQANPQAFDNNDMNRLKKGRIMRAPTAEELSAIDQASAEKEVQAHVKNWNAYRNKVAGMAAKSAPAKDDNQSSSKVSGKITSVRDQSETSGPRDVVKLSSGSPGTGAGGGKQTKAQMQEQLVANQKALTESNERIALLQKQLDDAQKLLALHDQAAAADKAGAGGKDAAKTGNGMQTSMDQLLKDPKIVPKAAGLLAVLIALWLLLRRKKDTKAKKAEAPTSAAAESVALADSELTGSETATVETVAPEKVTEEVSATDLVQEMQQAMQAADASPSTSTSEQEMVEAMQAASAAEDAEPSWADAGLPLPEEPAAPEVEEAEPSWADAGLPLPEEPAEVEPSWADAGLPLPEEPAAPEVEEAEPSWADAGLPLPEEEVVAKPAPEAIVESMVEPMPDPVAEPEVDEEVLSMDDVEMLMPEEFEPTESIAEPVVEQKPEPVAASMEAAVQEVAPDTDISGEAFDMDAVFDSDEALADMLADMPEQTATDDTASAMKEEAAMDEMVAAAMEEGDVDAEDQFDLDDVFGEAAAQAAEAPKEAEATEESLADLLPVEDNEAAPEVAADDHSEALAAAFDESATKDLQDLDFGFDVDLGEVNENAPVTKAVAAEVVAPEEPAPKKVAAKKPAAKKSAAKKTKKVEVEDIDLDVTGADSQAAAAVSDEAGPAASAESAEIDTMLDLVTAYIDMSDEEGARDLLKDILEKGGPEQKAKAQKMLDDLG
jgi:pilus assembly protein FimV